MTIVRVSVVTYRISVESAVPAILTPIRNWWPCLMIVLKWVVLWLVVLRSPISRRLVTFLLLTWVRLRTELRTSVPTCWQWWLIIVMTLMTIGFTISTASAIPMSRTSTMASSVTRASALATTIPSVLEAVRVIRLGN